MNGIEDPESNNRGDAAGPQAKAVDSRCYLSVAWGSAAVPMC